MEEHINHIQGIYCIKYKLNIIYIGQSVNINARFKQHLRALNRLRGRTKNDTNLIYI